MFILSNFLRLAQLLYTILNIYRIAIIAVILSWIP